MRATGHDRATTASWLSLIPNRRILSASSVPGSRRRRRDAIMRKAKPKSEGEICSRVRLLTRSSGQVCRRFAEGTNLVKLEPNVAKVFRDSASVNRALRRLVVRSSRKRAV